MSITFETVLGEDQLIHPPEGLVLPEGRLRVTVQQANIPSIVSQRSPAEILAEIAKLSTGSGDPKTSVEHDDVLYGDRRSR